MVKVSSLFYLLNFHILFYFFFGLFLTFIFFIISTCFFLVLDLGYNSEDADFEYYSKLKSKETSLLSPG